MSKVLNLELPLRAGSTLDRNTEELINDRLRRIAEELLAIGKAAGLSITGDLDMRDFRIVHLGTPEKDTDAVSVGFGDARFARKSHTHPAGTAAAPAATVRQALIFTVPGTLAIRSDAAARASTAEDKTIEEIVAQVKQAPTGADLKVEIKLGTAVLATLTIAAGQTKVTLAGSGLAKVTKNVDPVVNLLTVGTTFPGADLTVMIRFRAT